MNMQHGEDRLRELTIEETSYLSANDRRDVAAVLDQLDGIHRRAWRLSCRVTELEKRRDDLLKANNEEVERRRTAERERDEYKQKWGSAKKQGEDLLGGIA